jgi:hypothetical protein
VSGKASGDKPEGNPKVGCGCLIALLILVGIIVQSCSGGSEDEPEKPATFGSIPSTTSAPPNTARSGEQWNSPIFTSTTTATTTTTPQGTPKPRPNPNPNPDPNRNEAPAPARTTTESSGGGSAYYKNCAAARAAGAAPILAGEPGYRPALDGNSDGVACE